MKTQQIKINVPQFIRKLTQRNFAAIYYNKNCNVIMHPKEMKNIDKFLTILEFHDSSNQLDYQQLLEAVPMDKFALNSCIWKLAPICIDIRGLANVDSGYGGGGPRYYSINENGLAVLQAWREQDV